MSRNGGHSVVVIGASGSGKTSYVKKLFRKDGRKLYVVNGDEDDFPNSPNVMHQTFDESVDFKGYKNVNVMFDDVTAPTAGQAKHLRKMATVTKRHGRCGIAMVVHSLIGNNTNKALIAQFNEVVFCHESRNEQNWIPFTDRYTHMDPNEVASIWEEFMSAHPPFSYLVYDLVAGTYKVLDKSLKVCSGSDGKKKESTIDLAYLRRQCDKFLPLDNSKNSSMQLLEYIFSNSPQLLSLVSKDMELAVSKSRKVHLMDFLHVASSAKKEVRGDVLHVFKYIKKKVAVPDCLVRNEQLLDKAGGEDRSSEDSPSK